MKRHNTHIVPTFTPRIIKHTVLLLALAAHTMSVQAQKATSHEADLMRGLTTFTDITRQIDAYYVDTLNVDTMIRSAIRGMLSHIDPFTAYYPGDDLDDLKQMATGKYAGIGAVIQWRPSLKRCIISEPYEGTPAQEAGLRMGDIIMTIDGHDVEGLTTPKVSSMLRGEAGTTFVLEVKHKGELVKHKITRRNIQLPQVPYYGMLNDNTGYVYLTGFTEGAAQEVRRSVADLRKQGATSLVLDLRDNPGGGLEEAIDVVGLFVPHGSLVVSTRGKVAATCRELRTKTEPLVPDMRVCVLVDDGSASASEIVSGALQDMDRAVVVGQRTYGKGLVQAIRDAPYNGTLKLTTSRYYIPSGRCIQAYDYRHLNPDGSVGVVPDSVTRVFHTAAGRPVRDGGGIKPDVVVEADSIPTALLSLTASEAFTDWQVNYVNTHDNIADPSVFALSEEDWQSFVASIEASDFKLRHTSNIILGRLREAVRVEGFEAEAAEHLNALESIFAKDNIRTVLERNKELMKKYIETNLVRSYYYLRGEVQHSLLNDKRLQRAVEILQSDEYNQILRP